MLLSDNYLNPHQVLEFLCPKGHRGSVRFHQFKRGDRCAVCQGNAKISHQQAAAYFKQQGCELLEEFKNSQVVLKYRCICGRESRIRWYDFKNGKRCRGCLPARLSGPNSHCWNPDREAVAMNRKIACAAHTALKTTLKCLGVRKETKTYAILGDGAAELKRHIESHPDWENVKDKPWSLDHVFPIKAFVDFNICDVRLINSLDNLRPMLRKENEKKSARYDRQKFLAWLQGKGALQTSVSGVL